MTTPPAAPIDPVAAATDEARALARSLLTAATHAAIAVTDPADGLPGISRIAFGLGPDGGAVTLISALAPHFAALRQIAGRNGVEKLSMGMSDDFEIAIAQGATSVRVGSAIFGARDTGGLGTTPPAG